MGDNMFQKLGDRLLDRNYRITLTENFLNITNISKILILESTIILLVVDSIQIEIRGKDLVLKQMMDDEILITGTIFQIVKKNYE